MTDDKYIVTRIGKIETAMWTRIRHLCLPQMDYPFLSSPVCHSPLIHSEIHLNLKIISHPGPGFSPPFQDYTSTQGIQQLRVVFIQPGFFFPPRVSFPHPWFRLPPRVSSSLSKLPFPPGASAYPEFSSTSQGFFFSSPAFPSPTQDFSSHPEFPSPNNDLSSHSGFPFPTDDCSSHPGFPSFSHSWFQLPPRVSFFR